MEVLLATNRALARLGALGASGLSNQQIVLILAIVGVSALLLITTRRRVRRSQNSPQAYAREQIARLRNEQSLMQDMGELMAELEQFSRQAQARLDTKFAKLEAVIRDADQRIERLERLMRQADGGPGVDVIVDGSPDEASASSADDASRHELVFRLADAGLTPAQIAQETDQSRGEVELILALRKASSGATSQV
jgi:hypothetical protein